jgi:hypothetical protein
MEPFESQSDLFLEIGDREVWGGKEPFGFSRASLDQHLALVGKSGSGKSSVLRNLMLESIEVGAGAMLLDPHGDLARDVLECYPPARADHLIYLNAADQEHPIAFNVLANVRAPDRGRVAASIVSAFKAAFGDSWGPRLQRILLFSIASLLECDNVSLLAIPRLLVDAAYRDQIVRRVRDPVAIDLEERAAEIDEAALQVPHMRGLVDQQAIEELRVGRMSNGDKYSLRLQVAGCA